ncbi:MAG: TRAP transporter substrate-binding protein DctP [Brevinema sp.]
MKKTLAFLMIFVLTSCGTTVNRTGTSLSSNSLAYLDVPSNAEYILTTSHDHNTEGYNHLASLVFKAAVENKSNGRIGVKIYPNGQLAASGKEGVTGLINGTLDIFKVTGDLPTFWAPAAIFDIPYILPDDRVAEAVYGDEVFINMMRQDILKAQPKLKLMMVATSGGWRSFATTKKQIKTPNDMRGLKMRTLPSVVQQELVTSLGGAPTSMPYDEVYTSLSTGVVDGVNLSIVDIINAKLNESLKYYILDNHSYLIAFWFINTDKLKSMPSDLQKIVVDAFEDMRVWLNAYPKLAQVAAFDTFRNSGGTIYTPSTEELNQFKEATKSIRENLLAQNPQIRPFLDLLDEKVSYHEAEINKVRQQAMN